MHACRYGAETPNAVMRARSARRHRASGPGCMGLPSKSTTVEPTVSPDTSRFHIIQPVVLNQKNRSPGPRSRCRASCFMCSSRMPPWPWTIGLGRPVVPEEYRIHIGASKAIGSNAGSARTASRSGHSCASGMVADASRYGTSTVARNEGSSARKAATVGPMSKDFPP